MLQPLHYASADIELMLPPGWVIAQLGEDRVRFSSPDALGAVVASIVRFDASLAREAQIDLLRDVTERRVGEERKAVEGVTSTDVQDSGTYLQSRFGGADARSERRFSGRIVAERGRIVTLYVESVRSTPEAHARLSEDIFGSLEIQ